MLETEEIHTMVITLIVLNLMHWVADFTPLSTAWMQRAKRNGKPMFPILAHAAVHATFMGIALYVLHGSVFLWQLVLFQLVTHFLIDLFKGRLNVCFPRWQNPSNASYWMVFGADQCLHQFVIIVMAYGVLA